MATNNRIFYAIQAIGFAPHAMSSPVDPGTPSGFITAHGVQSVGITTTFNLEQVFELGQLEMYENIEGIPDIEMTAQKVLDGYPLLYHLVTQDATLPTLVGRCASARTFAALNIYPDNYDCASGVPITTCGMSGMYISALTYTLNVEGNSTEDITLVGNNKVWTNSSFYFLPDEFDGTDQPLALTMAGSGGVQRREDVLMGSGTACSVWPKDIPGIDGEGYNQQSGDSYAAHIQTVTVTANLGRTDLFELGRRGPYYRFVNFPLEVTCAIDITSSSGDQVDAYADPASGSNLTDQQITIKMREGTEINLGPKNKLASITYGGGDTGGGNVTTVFNYSNFNSLKVLHPQDPAGLS